MKEKSLVAIRERCALSRAHNNRARDLAPTGGAESLRATFARCAIDLALEHHSALTRVVEAGEYGTGAALLRPLLEASTTGYWFVYVAPCEHVRLLPTTSHDNAEHDIPNWSAMLTALTPIFPPIQAMSDALKRGGTAKWLHKYTHGGTPQLSRRVDGGWTEGEVILSLIRGDMFATLAICLDTVIAPSDLLFRYGFGYRDKLAHELGEKFGIPIPPQPPGLPDAPLLRDGCGPPFG